MRVAAAACVLAVACRGGSRPDLAAQLEQVRQAEHLPALGLAVWQHGQLVATATTGLRNADDPAHPETGADRWHLGSDTKAMTAALVGLYVDRGLIR